MTADQDLSAATADMAKSKPEPHWPVGLYAPGKYICFCDDCGKQHIAAKRALHCADCTIQRLFNRIANDSAKMDAMVSDHLAAVQAAVAKAVGAERESCASEADALSWEYWGEYKKIMSPHRADPHYQGMSDGAENVAAAIRSRGVGG